MTETVLQLVELRARGFEALVEALGWVNAVRFIQQYETSNLDYTAERRHILPDWGPDELVRRVQSIQQPPSRP